MTKQEFEARTDFVTTPEIYQEIEREYMSSDLDKDAFCKMWIKKGGIQRMSMKMTYQICDLKNLVEEERSKRSVERVHAEKELLDANIRFNALCELIKTFGFDEEQIRPLLRRSIESYKKLNGYC